jgi:Raf kinase inhibitor-like YbhB/YbcL family protein
MPKDRDQQTPVDPEDRERLAEHRGQGTAGSGADLLPGEAGGPLERIELTSIAFDDGDLLPARFAYDEENLSPPLEWSDVPPDTEELALLCQDPDAPSGLFTHWVLAGIDPTISAIDEGESPPGAVGGVNDFGEEGWGGPAPPPGDGPHRYVFTLFASSASLDLDSDASADDLLEALDGIELAQGSLLGHYER